MNPQSVLEAQQKFMEFQKAILETTTSTNNEVEVTFNGNLEIIALKLDTGISLNNLTSLLISTLNQGIKQTSGKIQEAVQKLQLEMSSIKKPQ